MIKLEPCPFCGADKPFKTVAPEKCTIQCRNRECGALITRWALKREWATESAVKAWNRRGKQ